VTGDEFAAGIRAIAHARQAMIDLSVRLRREPAVREASSGMDVREYTDAFSNEKPLCVELWTEAELRDGDARAWLLDLRWDGSVWEIEADLVLQTHVGQDVLKALGLRTAVTVEELAQVLAGVVRELVELPLTYPAA